MYFYKPLSAACFIAVLVVSACDVQESRPSYEPLQNIVPAGGMLIGWDNGRKQLNIEEVKAGLDGKSRAVFSDSMDWYATESDFGFESLIGKTASEAVDAINCLKVSAPDSQRGCME
jgi:hypothetical protein